MAHRGLPRSDCFGNLSICPAAGMMGLVGSTCFFRKEQKENKAPFLILQKKAPENRPSQKEIHLPTIDS